MAGETIITVVGNLTADPELRTTGKGASVASFTIASTPRNWNRDSNQFEDGQALFLRRTAWRDMAEHCARSLAKGMRVIAQGRLSQHSWEDENHNKRTSIEMQVEEIGPSLRYATAQVTRTSSPNTNRQGTQTGGYTGGGPFNTGQPQGAQISDPPTHGANRRTVEPLSAPSTPPDGLTKGSPTSDDDHNRIQL